MKLGKGIYVYQVYLDKKFPDEAELIKILEPYAKKRRSSTIIAQALIAFFLRNQVARVSIETEPEISADDIVAIDSDEAGDGASLIDKFTDTFQMG